MHDVEKIGGRLVCRRCRQLVADDTERCGAWSLRVLPTRPAPSLAQAAPLRRRRPNVTGTPSRAGS